MVGIIILLVIISAVVRIATRPFRYGYRRRCYGDVYYNPYRYGCRRRHGLVGGLLPIVALVALDRLFTRRFSRSDWDGHSALELSPTDAWAMPQGESGRTFRS
jgi:hypothetical protein